MTKYQVTMMFDSQEEMLDYFSDGNTKTDATPVVERSDDIPVVERTDDSAIPVDADGMPFDEEVHTAVDALTEKGLWRSKRGKSDEANKRRADFKAAGGDVTPEPEPEPEPETKSEAPSMPGMPGMAAAVAPPITMAKLIEKATGMIERQAVDNETLIGLYAKVGASETSVLETNESLRAALFAELCNIEPELP